MAGLWCGSMLTSARRPAQHDFRWLAGGEAGFVLLCGTLALLISVSGFTTSLSATAAYALILPLLLLCGFLTGLQFPPAVRLCGGESVSGLNTSGVNTGGVNSRAAARMYACDLLGGCLGGCLGGLLLLPVLGFRSTLLLLLLLKSGSFMALHISAIGGTIKT
jgi:spermidine synthase